MTRIAAFLLLITASTICYWRLARPKQLQPDTNDILSVSMNLSAFGVESDTYPSIAAKLDFERQTSQCKRSYYDPAYPGSTYQLSAEEMNKVQRLLQRTKLMVLKADYSNNRTDQPTSTIVIRTSSRTFIIKDYGLEGDAPLPEVYRLVYKWEY